MEGGFHGEYSYRRNETNTVFFVCFETSSHVFQFSFK